jgi:hypothetical protein
LEGLRSVFFKKKLLQTPYFACYSEGFRSLTKKILGLLVTNMMIGAILAIEALKAIEQNRFGLPSKETITYDARAQQRFGVVDFKSFCRPD